MNNQENQSMRRMSIDVESDSELDALRKELLTGLRKKQINELNPIHIDAETRTQCYEESKDQNDDENEEKELEMLRLQALNAKRSKTLNITTDSIQIKDKSLPGRFRYDKDSDNENDEEDDENEDVSYETYHKSDLFFDNIETELRCSDKKVNVCSINSVPHDKDENNNNFEMSEQTDPYHSNEPYRHDPQRIVNHTNKNELYNRSENFNKAEFNNYHCNYQTYRVECSRLMSNDAYDPNSICDEQINTLPQDFDLRNFLREKAYRQQEQFQSENIGFLNDNPDEIVYSEPITKPIEVKKEFNYKYRHKNFSRYNNEIGYYGNGSSESVSTLKKYGGRRLAEVNIEDRREDDKNECNLPYEETDSDDDIYLNKKLKSVVTKPIVSNHAKHEIPKSRYDQREDSMIKDRQGHQRHYKRK